MDEREQEIRLLELRQREFAERFGAALETWRFQVNSYWQRTTYFSAFQAVVVTGVWNLFIGDHYYSSIALSVFGAILSAAWCLNNVRVHEYAGHWWQSAGEIEEEFSVCDKRKLVADYDKRRKQRHTWSYEHLDIIVPCLFMAGWLLVVAATIHTLATIKAIGHRP